MTGTRKKLRRLAVNLRRSFGQRFRGADVIRGNSAISRQIEANWLFDLTKGTAIAR